MSDSTPAVLDPKRPWLTDARELPERMNWAQTLFDPTGESPRLHFTRAWTLLFGLQLAVVVLPWTIAQVLNVAGGDGAPVAKYGLYLSLFVFVVTTLMSYVIHSRRLNDAGKPQWLAIVPLVPLLIGLALFVTTAQGTSAQYDKQFEERQEYRADPEAFRAKQLQAAREATEKAKAEAESEDGEQAQRGGPPRPARNLDKPMAPKAEFVLKAAIPAFQMSLMVLSAFVAIWSLMWVARVPFFGRYPGQPDVRTELQGRPYEN